MALYLRNLLRGEYDSLGSPPPMRSLDSLESTARRALSRVGAGLHVPGRLIVVGLGHALRPRRPPRMCGEATQGRVVAYDPTLPDAEISLFCAHGAAHGLIDDGDPRTHADTWLLTTLLLVPRAAAQTMCERELVERSHCPAWITRATRGLLLRWDSLGETAS